MITQSVLASFQNAPTPRIRQLLLAVVKHLHALTTEVELTPDQPDHNLCGRLKTGPGGVCIFCTVKPSLPHPGRSTRRTGFGGAQHAARRRSSCIVSGEGCQTAISDLFTVEHPYIEGVFGAKDSLKINYIRRTSNEGCKEKRRPAPFLTPSGLLPGYVIRTIVRI
jgi:hypothetical protein